MRTACGLAAVAVACGLAVAQQEPPDRYGLAPATDLYPQATPQDALKSALRAVEKNRVDYLTAHLLSPAWVDGRVAERAKALEPTVEAELLAERARQKQAGVARDQRLPDDPPLFLAVVAGEAQQRAFRLVVSDIQATLAGSPDHVRDLRKFAREGQFGEAGDTARATLKNVTDKEVVFARVGPRWFVDNKKKAEPAVKK